MDGVKAGRPGAWLVAAALIATSLAGTTARAETHAGVLQAGVAKADLTWAAGASAGQVGTQFEAPSEDSRFDLYASSKLKQTSEGFESRSWARALVVEGTNGERLAYVQLDSYLMQDALHRKVAELLARHDQDAPAGQRTGIGRDRLILGSTHNHSAPGVTSTAWGVWVFTDAYDLRNFHYMARQTAQAVIDATAAMRPVRMGATVAKADDVQHNIVGPSAADDGTPAGYPYAYFGDELTLVRFDDISEPTTPVPYAVLANFGMHPESLPGGHLLLSADFNASLHIKAERALQARYGGDPMLIWSQGNVGDTEPDRAGRGRSGGEFWRRGFASTELISKRLARSVVDGVAMLDSAPPETTVAGRVVPFTDEAPVEIVDMYLPGPINETHPTESRPVPAVENCRTVEVAVDRGEARVGTVADCTDANDELGAPYAPTPLAGVIDRFEEATGLSFPRNQGAQPSRGLMNETLQIHATVARIGEVLIGTCPCEAQTDQVLNFLSRTDTVVGNIEDGYEWPCVADGPDAYLCSFPDPDAAPSYSVPKDRWDAALTQLHADARDPDAPGNWSRFELGAGAIDAGLYAGRSGLAGDITFDGVGGFAVPIMIAQAQDYTGYYVSFREFMARDHYRKTLTSFGPHTADYVNTYLLRAARQLRTGEADPLLSLFTAPIPDPVREAEYQAYAGVQGEAAVAAYEAALPDDAPSAGTAASEPDSKDRFGVARFTWIGGSNAVDLPHVSVVDPDGEVLATNDYGEIVTTVEFPRLGDTIDWAAGDRVYRWTAHWETGVDTQTGSYRFVVDGHKRTGAATVPYRVESDLFEVDAWVSGATIGTPHVSGDTIEFTVSDVPYPDRYDAADLDDPRLPTFIDPANRFQRTFRLRPTTWTATQANVRITTEEGIIVVPAVRVGSTFVAHYPIAADDLVEVVATSVRDEHGNPAA